MKVIIMQKRFLKTILVGVCFVVISQSLSAQWGFTPTLKTSGKCWDAESQKYINQMNAGLSSIFTRVFPTKADCEMIRQLFLNTNRSFEGCRIYYTCTACTGTDMATSNGQSTTGYLNFNGINQGSAIFSSNPGNTNIDWIDQANTRTQALGLRNENNNSVTPTTKDKDFNEYYADSFAETMNSETGDKEELRRKGRTPLTPYYDPYLQDSGNKEKLYEEEVKSNVDNQTPATTGKKLAEPDQYETELDQHETGLDQHEWGEDVGIHRSDYISDEELNRDSKTMTKAELDDFDRRVELYLKAGEEAYKKANIFAPPNFYFTKYNPNNTISNNIVNSAPVLSYGATVNTNVKPIAPEPSEASINLGIQTRNTRNKIADLEAEIAKLNRLIDSKQFTSEDYQTRKEKAEQELKGTKSDLVKLMKQEADNKVESYRTQLAQYQKDKANCGSQPCQEALEREIADLEWQIIRAEGKSFVYEVNAFADRKRNEAEQISWADKTEENADERLIRIDEQRKELQENLTNKKISAIEFKLMSDDLSDQEQAAIADRLAAKTARTATNAYMYVQENKEIIIEKSIDVAEFAAHTVVDIAAATTATETAGTSLLLAATANIGISTVADMARGQELGDAARGAVINELTGAAIDRIVPIKMIVGGKTVNRMHMNTEGQVVYQTTKKIGGIEITPSTVKNVWDIVGD
jgi:hypothetical protein